MSEEDFMLKYGVKMIDIFQGCLVEEDFLYLVKFEYLLKDTKDEDDGVTKKLKALVHDLIEEINESGCDTDLYNFIQVIPKLMMNLMEYNSEK